jgi:predicted SAM-dependent methyltransferase
MRANALLHRTLRSRESSETLRVHLGPGQKNYMRGWTNVDANMFTAKCDIWADLRYPLPFRASSIDAVYSHHVIEHLPNLVAHFKEAYRCLKPGGAYRVAGPDGDSAMQKFSEGDVRWFGDWPDKRRSVGGRFENFIFCRGEHLTILTYSFLEEMLTDAGFVAIKKCMPSKQTFRPNAFLDCLAMEHETDFAAPHTLVIEAEKPATAC